MRERHIERKGIGTGRRGAATLVIIAAVAAGCDPGAAPQDDVEVVRGELLSFGKWSGCQPTHYTLHGGQPMRGPTPTAPVKVVPVLWGTGATLGFTTAQFDSFFASSFGGSSWWSWIRREYHLPNVTQSPWVTLNLSAHAKNTSPVTESDIRAEVLAHLTDGSLPLYGGGSNAESMLYVIHVPGNVEVSTDGDPNMWYCAGADGTHKQGQYYYPCAADATSPAVTFAGVPIRMVIMPDQTSTKCKSHCDPNNTRPALDLQTMTESHEIVGVLSNPWDLDGGRTVHGWYSTNNCSHLPDSCQSNPVTTTGGSGSTVVQMMWSQKAGRCVGNSPGALGDVTDKGTSAIVLTGDTDPGSSTGTIHIAQASPGAIGSTALQPFDMPYTQGSGFAEGWMVAQKHGKPLVGDFLGLGDAAIALVGASSDLFQMIVKDANGRFSEPGGGMTTVGAPNDIRAKLISNTPGAKNVPALALDTTFPPVTGDFNGDGRADIALVGGPGWTSIPVAISTTSALGQFWGVADIDSGFNSYITNSANKPQFVSADFNGDGLSDLALVGITQTANHGWDYIAVARAVINSAFVGDGSFVVQSYTPSVPAGAIPSDFNSFASATGAQAVAGDFDGDGFGDIALAGGAGWTSIPVLFSRGAGTGALTFTMTNVSGGDNATFASKASQAGAKVVAGDFDGNGTSDLAVLGTAGNFIGLAMNSETPATPGKMIWVNDTSNLATFTTTAAKTNVLAAAPSRGPVDFVAPPAPAGPTATPLSAQVNLTWSRSPGAVTYNVYRGTAPGAQAATPIATGITGLSYTDRTVAPSTKYYFKMAGVGAAGIGPKSPEVSATTPASAAVRINCGDNGAFAPFTADQYFSGGAQKTRAVTISVSGVTNPAPLDVYKSQRYSSPFSYTIPGFAAGSNHLVRLHFAETNPANNTTNKRKFSVAINGTTKISNLDLFAAAGLNHALVKEFTVAANSSGQYVISFTASLDSATISGIEVQ